MRHERGWLDKIAARTARRLDANLRRAATEEARKSLGLPRFEQVSCSQCGRSFGPGDSGYSHCKDHEGRRAVDA